MYFITNRHLCSRERYFEVIKEAVNFGVENIIIREKDLSDKDLENLCLEIRDIVDKLFFERIEVKTNFIINSNTNLYLKLDFDGMHLPFRLFLDLIEKEYYFKRSKILGLSLVLIGQSPITYSIIRNSFSNIFRFHKCRHYCKIVTVS